MDLTVSIVTYNSAETIRDCIESLLAQSGIEFQVVIVDNNSSDETLDVLRTFGEQVRVIAGDKNIGFGPGHNLGVRNAGESRYLLVLNPDARIVSVDGLKRLVEGMDADPQCGLSGMAIIKEGERVPPKMHYPGAKRAPADFSDLPGDIAWVVGASMMIRRDVFDQLEGFDEEFFMYGEETDFCIRTRKAGYTIGYNEEVEVAHIGGVSESSTPAYELQMQRQKRLHRLYRKHYPHGAAMHIIRQDLRQSRYRLLLHTLKGRLFGMTHETSENCGRYRAIAESCRRFLDEEAAQAGGGG
jgi:GT2 family glycosyltransferase